MFNIDPSAKGVPSRYPLSGMQRADHHAQRDGYRDAGCTSIMEVQRARHAMHLCYAGALPKIVVGDAGKEPSPPAASPLHQAGYVRPHNPGGEAGCEG